MKLTWHGHACFTIESYDYRAVIDPFTRVPGYSELSLRANAVYASHGHFDHHYFDAVTLAPWDGNTPIRVTTLPCFHDNCGGTQRGENLIHIFEAEGMKTVHLGDLGHLLNDSQLATVQNCDCLLIPVGGFYTIDAEMARQAYEQIKPRITVPMHFRYDGRGLDKVSGVEPFLERVSSTSIRYYPDGTLTFDADTMRQIAVLK